MPLGREENTRDADSVLNFGRDRNEIREFPTERNGGRGIELGGRNVDREIIPENTRGGERMISFGENRNEEVEARGAVSEAVMPNQENVQKPIAPVAPPKPRVIKPYVRVPLDDFDCRDVEPTSNAEEVEETKNTIIGKT